MKARNSLTRRLVLSLFIISLISVFLAEIISGFILFYRESDKEHKELQASAGYFVAHALSGLTQQDELSRLSTRLKSAISFSNRLQVLEVRDAKDQLIESTRPDFNFDELKKADFFIVERTYELKSGESRVFRVAAPKPSIPELLHDLVIEDSVILLVIAMLSWVFARAFASRLILPVKRVAGDLRNLTIKDPMSWALLQNQDDSEFLGEIVRALNNLISRVQQASLAQDHLARYVAHEVKTPLTIMLGEIQTFSSQEGLNQNIRKLFLQFEEDISHINIIVNSVLDLASRGRQRSPHRPEVSEVDQVVQMALKEFSRGFSMACSFENLASHSSAMIDPNLLRILTDNLFRNVAKHGGKASKISVKMMDGADGGLVLEIADSGQGFPAEIIEAFDSNWSTGKNLGIGLSLCREICNIAGWKMSLSNREPEGGGLVRLSLPSSSIWVPGASRHETLKEFRA